MSPAPPVSSRLRFLLGWETVVAVLAVACILVAFAHATGGLRLSLVRSAEAESRQLALGESERIGAELAGFAEEFTFSLTTLPYTTVLEHGESNPEAMLPIRRFFALNQTLLSELRIVSPAKTSGRVVRREEGNYFKVSDPIDAADWFAPAPGEVALVGEVHDLSGESTCVVVAIVNPMRLAEALLTRFALSHPHAVVILLDEEAAPRMVRQGGVLHERVHFTEEIASRLARDARDRYEGGQRHSLDIGNPPVSGQFVSGHSPVAFDKWAALLLVALPESRIFDPVEQTTLVITAAGFLLACVSGLLLWGNFRKIRAISLAREEARRRMATILDTVQSGILLLEEPGQRIVEANPTAARLLGFDPSQLADREAAEFFPPDALVPRTGRSRGDVETMVTRSDGHHFPALVNTTSARLEGREFRICSFVDISSMKEARERLVEAQDRLRETNGKLKEAIVAATRSAREAEAASRAKGAFLAMMSHEIRTPLNGITGFTSLLQTTSLNSEQSNYVGTIHKSAELLLAIINDILDFSKIESGHLQVENLPLKIRDCVSETVALLSPAAADKKLALECVIDPGLPKWVLGDPVRLRQILVNLIANAIKFTESGSVSIAVGTAPIEWDDGRDDANRELTFAVTDTGIGISSEQMAKLFQPFSQADAGTTRKFGGTGLGLVISKRLVELMGGRMEVGSAPGKGSVFRFTFPMRHPEQQSIDALEKEPPQPHPESTNGATPTEVGLRILVAEDNPVNQRVALFMLKKLGYTAELAIDGVAALEAALRTPFDIILLDHQMPRMDGTEVARALRAAEKEAGTARPAHIIAVTGNAMAEDRTNATNSGMNDFLPKPLNLNQLDAVLRRAVAARREA